MFIRYRDAFVLLLLVCISTILILFGNRIQGIKSFLLYLILPTQQTGLKVIQYGEGFCKKLAELVTLDRQNKQLQLQLQNFSYLKSSYNALLEENKKLREILNFKLNSPLKLLPANVISRGITYKAYSLLIDKGEDENIKLDSQVISFDGNTFGLVGHIVEVGKKHSRVRLLISELSAVPVEIRQEEGLVEGQNSPLLLLNYILPESKIAIGDYVVTSGVGKIYSRGLPVGYIQEILPVNKETGFKQALVKPVINPGRIKYVFIIM